jgi:hypothetical protein
METIEQLKTRQVKELEAAEKLHLLAAELPAPPGRLSPAYRGHYWATYKTATTSNVAALIRQFAPLIVPIAEIRDGCLYQVPADLLPTRAAEKYQTEGTTFAFGMDTRQGRGYGVTVRFWFYCKVPSGVIVKIICDLPDNYRAGARLVPPEYDRRGQPITQGSASPNPTLRGIFHDHTSWGSNRRGEDAHYTFKIFDDAPEYREACEILENSEIANWWRAPE